MADDEEGDAAFSAECAVALAEQGEIAKHEGDAERCGEELADQHSAQAGAVGQADHGVIVAGEEQCPAEREEGDGGVERHGDVAGDDVEGFDAVGVADEGGEGDDAGGEDERLAGAACGGFADFQYRQGCAEDDEAEGAVGIDVAFAGSGGEEQVVEAEIDFGHIGNHADAADEEDDGSADAAGPFLPAAASGEAEDPEAGGGGDESDGDHRIHRNQAGGDGFGSFDAEDPAHHHQEWDDGGNGEDEFEEAEGMRPGRGKPAVGGAG